MGPTNSVAPVPQAGSGPQSLASWGIQDPVPMTPCSSWSRIVVHVVPTMAESGCQRHVLLVGWGTDQGIGGFGEEPGIKAQLMNLIRSVRTVMRVPLIAVNSITIVLLLLFG
uniref:Immediate early response 3-interacting protein 1 n=1 Tax=Crocodylus porosus TaxID=8502 RepID=A0A7M4FAU1_CROPO